jgi:hypothetical protein
MGQLLGATSMIAGSIGKVGPIFLVSLRLIDVGTGKILQNVDVEIEGGIADVLRRGIPRIARKIAGQSVPETVPAKPVTTTEPAPVRTATVASSTRNGMGTLAVNCNFRDAKVLVDNEVVSTPATLKLPAGDHSVIGKLEGAGDFNEIVTIDPGAKHTVDVEIGNPYGLGGLGWYGGMLGCIAYGISMFVMAGDDMNYDVGIGAGIGLMSTGGLFGFLGTRKFVQRARWRRNHDIALEVDPGAAALRICILRSGNP